MASLRFGSCIFESLSNGTLSLSEYLGDGGILEIPSFVEHIPVSDIDPDAFDHSGPVTGFSVPDDHPSFSVRDGVLYNKTFDAIIRYPFGREDESFRIPSSVKDLRHSAFAESDKLKSVVMPDTLEGMGSHAFSHCGALETIHLSDKLIRMGRSAFRGCTSLKNIELKAHHPMLEAEDGFLVNVLQQSLVICLPALCKPEMDTPSGISQIEEFAFYHCNMLESVRLHHGLRNIGRYAFYHCDKLSDINLPSSLRSIGSRAFSGCTSLETLTMPDNVTSIEYKAFNNCDKLVLIVDRHSYAERYCRQFNMPCKHIFRWPWQK